MIKLIPYRACYIDKKEQIMLFSSSLFNGLFQMNLKNGDVKNLGIIPNEKIFGGSLYSSMVLYNNEMLILTPLNAREISILERKTGRCIKKIKLPAYEDMNWKFVSGIVYGNDIILIPACYPYFLSVNMIDFSIEILQNWKEYLMMECQLYHKTILTSFTVGRLDSSLFFPVLDSRYLLKFDMKKKKIVNAVTLPGDKYAYALCNGDGIYVIPSRSGEILCVNANDNKIIKTLCNPIEIEKEMQGHISIHGLINREKLILFPQMASRIGVVDLKTGEKNSFKGDWSIEENGKQRNVFQKIDMKDDRYCIVLVCHSDKRDYSFLMIDTVDFSVKKLKMNIMQNMKEYWTECVRNHVKKSEIIDENILHMFGVNDIFDFLIAITDKRESIKDIEYNNGVGEKIFYMLKGD